jgi:trehalose/maltose hydrolase-like predicted phosphorylase
MAGRPVPNEDLVNLPNWLVLKLQIEEDEPISLANVDVLDYRHELDIRNSMVLRTVRFRDHEGRETTLRSRRFASMATMHQGALEWTITPENWSGRMTVLSALDGRVTNWGVARYRELEGRHLDPELTQSIDPDMIGLRAHTRQSRIAVAEVARTRLYGAEGPLAVSRDLHQMDDYVHEALHFTVEEHVPIRIEKLAALYTSRDRAISEPLTNAGTAAARFASFAESFERHRQAWDRLWTLCDMRIPQNDEVQRLVRFHMLHILQTCSPHTVDLDAGLPARGLNGEAYRGHVFWDELYVYPFLNLRLPQITRALLMYRYRRLDEARAAAREAGYRGAMYPWQSGSDGREETPVMHLNPNSGRWHPDLSHNQRHVNAAIFYNIWRYYETTGDVEFLRQYGAEMMLEIARFWSSIAHFNPARERYEIHGVMGPDEFHEKYHDADEAGLRNNAYTNVMVAWLCGIAQNVLDLLPEQRRQELCATISLADDEIRLWRDMHTKMFVPFHDDGVISQFEGYEDLEELDWDAYREKYGNIQRLDRILRAEDDSPDRYKLAKQADTLMLWFLLRERELQELFKGLGYAYTPPMAQRTIEYYLARTSHGSTLSFVVHSAVLVKVDPDRSWDMLMRALRSDVGDIQGGTTKEGIHLGVMVGTLDVIQRSYLGMDIHDDTLYFRPGFVARLDGLGFSLRFRGTPVQITLEGGTLRVAVGSDGPLESVQVAVGETVGEIKAGEQHSFDL